MNGGGGGEGDGHAKLLYTGCLSYLQPVALQLWSQSVRFNDAQRATVSPYVNGVMYSGASASSLYPARHPASSSVPRYRTHVPSVGLQHWGAMSSRA